MAKTFSLDGLDVRAVSVAGMETCIELPGLKTCFDIGHGHRSTARNHTVLFTHAHIDHMGGIGHHAATRSLLSMAPPTYVVPKPVEAGVNRLLDAFRALDGSEMPATVKGLQPGEEMALGKRWTVRPLPSFHPVPSQGYVLMERRKRLKPELKGAGREAIRQAALRGEEINEELAHPKLVFSGDTTIEFIERNPLARQADVLIMEVTFVDDRVSVESARKNGHIHLDEVAERASLFQNKAILFTHLSARYREHEARQAIAERLPQELKDRVTLLGF
jgi:ribonuclease Z